MLVLDAATELPRHTLTLTTRSAANDAKRFREGMAWLFSTRDGLRSRWQCEYFAKVEFSTGKAATSGGHRRMHAHLLVKGLDAGDVDEAAAFCRLRWKRATGAWRVQLEELRTPAAMLGYLGLHHAKASQLPPPWWRGMVERSSRGYWSAPIAQLREEARLQLWAEGLAHVKGIDVATARRRVDRDVAARRRERETATAALDALRHDMPAVPRDRVALAAAQLVL